MVTRRRKLSKLAVVGTAVACAAFVLAACGSSSTTTTTTAAATTHMVKVPGGTLTIAEAPAGGPNYIFR